MRKNMVAAVVILYNWNQENIDNINSYASYFDEIILIDNSDKKVQIKLNPDFTYFSFNENLGIATALNKGIEIAREHGMEYVVTMDQDSRFKNNIVEIYFQKMKLITNNQFILSPNYIVDYQKTSSSYSELEEIYWTAQSGCLFPISIFDQLGNFKEDFFIDVVDYEYCIRAKNNGIKVIRVNNAEIFHKPGETKQKKILGKRIEFASHNQVRIYYQVRNLLWSFINYKEFSFFKVYFRIFIKILLLFDNKISYLKYFFKGTKDAIGNKLGKLVQ